MKLPWQPHTVKPKLPTTAIIAQRDMEGRFFLLGSIYTMNKHTNGKWVDEMTDAVLKAKEYYWLNEDVLTKSVNEIEQK